MAAALIPLIIQALPWIGATLAGALAYAAYLTGVGPELAESLRRLLASSGIQRIREWFNLRDELQALLASPLVQEILTRQGAEATLLQAQVSAGISNSIQAEIPPLTFPTFTSLQQADAWRAQWTALFQAGAIPDATIRQVESYYYTEWYRLSAPAALVPILPLTQVQVPGFGTVGVTVRVGGQLVTAGAVQPAAPSAPTFIGAPNVNVTIDTQALAAAISQALTSALSQVGTQVAEGTAAGGVATGEGLRALSPALVGAMAALGLTMSGALTGVGTNVATGIAGQAQNLGHGMQTGRYGCQGGFLPSLLGLATSIGPQVAVGALLATKNPMRQALDDLVDRIILEMMDPERFVVPTSYEEAVKNASSRLTQAVGYGLTAQAISFTAEALTPMKQMGFSQIAGFMGDLAGFQRIAAGLMGTVENAAIYRPLMYEANRRFRPNIPDDRQLTLMFQKRSLTRAELSGYQERLGLPDLYIDRLPGFIFNDPNPALIIRAFQIAEPGAVVFSEDDQRIAEIAGIDLEDPDAYFRLKLAKSGLDDTDVQAFIPVIKMGILRREQTIRYTQVDRLYRDGFITTERARAEITLARQPAPVVDYRMAAMELSREYDLLRDTRSAVLMAMSRGLISREEAREQLGRLGMPGERVELEVVKATLGMIPGVRLQVSRPEELLEELPVE